MIAMRKLALLALSLLAGPAWAALPSVTITGNVLMPDGVSAPSSGRITCRLSQAGSALDGGTSMRLASEWTTALGAGGAVSFTLVPNDQIMPSGTAYICTIQVRSPALTSAFLSWSETWQLASSPNPIAIGAVPRLNVIPGVAVGLVPATSTVTGGIRLTNDLGGTATAPTVARFGGTILAGVCNDVTDDTAAIQAAIDAMASAGSGTVELPSGICKISDHILMKSNVHLVGQGGRIIYQAQGGTWWVRGGQLGVTGTVLHQVTASKDAILIQNQDGTGAPLYGVGVRRLAIAFGGSVNGSPQAAGIATGHGINMKPPASGVSPRNSAVSADIGDIVVYGHDGDHYAWRFEGLNTSTIGQLISYGGGGFWYKGPDGNSTFPGVIQVFWQNAGTAHGFFLDGLFTTGTGSYLNFNTFNYVQVNVDLGVGNVATGSNFSATNLGAANSIQMFDGETWSGTPATSSFDGSPLAVFYHPFAGQTLSAGSQGFGFVAYKGSGDASSGAFIVRSTNYPSTIGNLWYVDYTGVMHSAGVAFGSLGAPANGSIVYCTDCTIANPCAAGGTGALAKRLGGAWVCN